MRINRLTAFNLHGIYVDQYLSTETRQEALKRLETAYSKSLSAWHAGIAAQILFSEQVLSRWLRLEWLRRECELTYEELFRHLQSKGQIDVFALQSLGRYEIAKANAALPLSSRVFESNVQRTDAEWAKVRQTLGL